MTTDDTKERCDLLAALANVVACHQHADSVEGALNLSTALNEFDAALVARVEGLVARNGDRLMYQNTGDSNYE